MYLCGPSVLACWAGKAVLILILLPPSIFGPVGNAHYIAGAMPKWYAVVINTLVAGNGNPSYSCAVRFSWGAPLGAGATPSPIRSILIRVVVITSFPICIISSSPAPIRLSRSRHSGGGGDC